MMVLSALRRFLFGPPRQRLPRTASGLFMHVLATERCKHPHCHSLLGHAMEHRDGNGDPFLSEPGDI